MRGYVTQVCITHHYWCGPSPSLRLRMTACYSRVLHVSKLVRAMGTEDEFELQENRIDFAIGEEEVRL